MLLVSCASPGPPTPVATAPVRDDPYLAAPLAGYPLIAPDELAQRADVTHGDLLRGRGLDEVEAAARELIEGDPGFHPAHVLLAQVEYLRRDDRAAMERLERVAGELPDYVAAQLLLGRVAERAGDLPSAFEAFSHIAGAGTPPVELAARRAAEIRTRAVEIVLHRLQDEVARGRLEGAEAHLAWLEQWAGDGLETLEGARLVAVEKGDLERELEVVRRLAEATGDRGLLIREAELEVEIGDVRVGLEKLEVLAERHPEDGRLSEALERAKFIWRLQLLPQEVQDVGRQGELDRSDVATLLYWLVPRVRYSQISNPPIATDILDHPRRDVILRVLNLGLLDVDETLHRFEPEAPATRVMVFRALATLLAGAERELSCLADGSDLELDRSWHSACRLAARCRLIPEAAECRPSASISGPEALELFRRTLDLLGSS